MAALLEVDNLGVRFTRKDAPPVDAVSGVSFSLEAGKTLGIVGESGSGKSQTVMALLGLLAGNGTTTGAARYRGDNLLEMDARALNKVRGDRIAMIFQDPMTSLNPFLTIERQMTETLQLHRKLSRKEATKRAIEALESVRIPDAARRIRMYPHEFSGGMRQRVMIAMALLSEPEILIADEPTTALDVTIQAQIMDLLVKLQKERGMALVLISHDLAVVSEVAQRVAVMYAGEVIETNSVPDIFRAPHHPYTEALLAAIPEHNQGARRLAALPGMVPGRDDRPSGCLFAPRCKYVVDDCRKARPALDTLVPGNDAMRARCIKPLNVSNLDLTGGAR